MKPTIAAVLAFLILLVISPACWARFVPPPGMADSWGNSSIVVLGSLQRVEVSDDEAAKGWGRYEVKVEKRYKGDLLQGKLEFVDPFDRVDGYVWLVEDDRCLIFLQTAVDRKESNYLADSGLGKALSRLRAFTVEENNLGILEEAITLISTYLDLPETGQKPFLLENLTISNSYIRPLIDNEIVRIRMTEAIPYYQEKLRRAADEEGRLREISTLRLLGDPGVKATLLEWLNDDSYKTKRDILEEFVRLEDKSVIPEIRKWIDVEDAQVAVTARSALLRLGESDAKGLLLEMIQLSDDPTARYNAIHCLNWNNEHGFTEEEIAVIRPLVNDEQESVARVTGFIIENWDRKSNKQDAGDGK